MAASSRKSSALVDLVLARRWLSSQAATNPPITVMNETIVA